MSEVVFILGAGASHHCGAPLMAEFLDVASDLLLRNQAQGRTEDFQQVFHTISGLQAVHSKSQLDLTNVESVFTALELGKVLGRVPGLNVQDIPRAIAALKSTIVGTLEMRMHFPFINNRIVASKEYHQLADLLLHLQTKAFPTRKASVITFNYDIGVDLAMFRSGIGPDYAFDAAPGSRSSIQLMKLHGSLNWASEKGTGKVLALQLEPYFAATRFTPISNSPGIRVPIGSQLAEHLREHDIEREPVIVPPSWNKTDYHAALSNVWSAAAKHLSEATHIFIIGYSLPETDAFFRHLYALGSVGSAPLRDFVVFDPDTSGNVDSRFKRLLGPGAAARYRYCPMRFGDAIQYIEGLFPERS